MVEKNHFFATIQFLIYRSQVSLRGDALSFHSLEITAFKFLGKSLRKQLTENWALVPYFIVPSDDSTNVDDAFPNLNPSQRNYGPAELLQSLHESVKCALEKRTSSVLYGLTAATSSDVHKYLVHSMISS